MRYYKFIIAGQLLLGSIWCFYYSIHWAGFLLLVLSSFTFIPLINNRLKKKMSGLKSGCLLTSVIIISLIIYSASYLGSLLSPVETKTASNSSFSIYGFEQKLLEATQPCFNSYDKAFSSSIKYKEEQCSLILEAQKACNLGQQKVDSIVVENTAGTEMIKLLNEIKTDAKSSLQGWENFFALYNSQCSSSAGAVNPVDAKLQLVSAIKNMYLMNMKIKKAKSIS